ESGRKNPDSMRFTPGDGNGRACLEKSEKMWASQYPRRKIMFNPSQGKSLPSGHSHPLDGEALDEIGVVIMARLLCRFLFAWALLGGVPWLLTDTDIVSAQDAKKEDPLADFRTVETAITTRISKAAPVTTVQPGYLGIHVINGDGERVVIAHLQADSPAAKAGVKEGDVLTAIAGQA